MEDVGQGLGFEVRAGVNAFGVVPARLHTDTQTQTHRHTQTHTHTDTHTHTLFASLLSRLFPSFSPRARRLEAAAAAASTAREEWEAQRADLSARMDALLQEKDALGEDLKQAEYTCSALRSQLQAATATRGASGRGVCECVCVCVCVSVCVCMCVCVSHQSLSLSPSLFWRFDH